MDRRTMDLGLAGFLRQALLCTFLLIVALISISPSVGDAQVSTNITSSGLNTQVDQVGNSSNITGGTRPGNGPNLFHSFGNFSLGGGDLANFLNNTGLPTSNILGRVTGGNISNIDGTIQTTGFGSANLFLMNPSGIVLGPGASLNVGGSVSFTTAQYLRLLDGLSNSANFYANPANDGLANSILTINSSAFEFLSASPAGYGFLTAPDPNATITVQGSNLAVPSGQSISLVGGKVVIENGAQLSAPNGTLGLASAASPGEFDATTLSSLPNVDGTSFISSGSVSLATGSSIDVHGPSTVFIKGGQLVLSVNNATLSTSGNPVPPETIALRSGSSIKTSNSGTDPGADVHITVGNIEMDGSSAIETITQGAGIGGAVQLTAETLTLRSSSILTATPGGGGVGGDVVLNLRTLNLTDGASIRTQAENFTAEGPGGNLIIRGRQGTGSAAESVTLSGGSGLFSETFGSTDGGSISLTSKTLQMDGTGTTINTLATDLGRGGNLVMNVLQASLTGEATITGVTQVSDPNAQPGPSLTIQGLQGAGSRADSIVLSGSGSGIKSESAGLARAGDIAMHTKSLTMTNEAAIKVVTSGTGGNVTLETDTIDMSGKSSISSETSRLDVGQIGIRANTFSLNDSSISTNTTSEGRAGDMVVNAGTLRLSNKASITSSTNASGQAGDITIAGNTAALNSGSTINSASSGTEPTVNLDGTTAPPGQAGTITITASGDVTSSASTISTSAEGNHGGDISITAQNVQLSNGSVINASTNGPAQVTKLALDGNGNLVEQVIGDGGAGTITISTGSPAGFVSVTGGSSITSSTTAGGNAGQVVMTTPTLTMNNAAITTSTSSSGKAGSITVEVGTLTMTNSSAISSNSTDTGTGNAGSITIGGLASPTKAVTITDSAVLTTAENAGQGGSITMHAANLALKDATISASVKNVPTNEIPSVGTANIALSAELITMDGSRITAESFGSRNAGSILINSPTALGKRFEMVNSQINTSAALADGGNIAIYTKDIVRLTDSTITSSVGNETIKTTQGGNITIDPEFVILRGGEIRANAFAGTGGAIDITSGLFLADAPSIVDASSTLGVSGTVQINSPINNLSSVVARLPESLLAVQALLRASCAAKLAQGSTSSFVERGRDSIPAGPDGLLASPYLPPTSSLSAQRPVGPSAWLSGVQLRRLFRTDMPASVTLISDHGGCVS